MAATITTKFKLKFYLFIYADSAMISMDSTTSHRFTTLIYARR